MYSASVPENDPAAAPPPPGAWLNGVVASMFDMRASLPVTAPADTRSCGRDGRRSRRRVEKPSHRFSLPDGPATPVILIGFGVGASKPLEAFLRQRKTAGATGENWLILGGRPQRRGVLRVDELAREGLVTKLDVHLKRGSDAGGASVTDLMFEHARGLWVWIDLGASCYVCAHGRRGAVDVRQALTQLIAEEGRMSYDDASTYVTEMGDGKRYQAVVC